MTRQTEAPTLTPEEAAFLIATEPPMGRVPAVKSVRERLGLGLAEAKAYVEATPEGIAYTKTLTPPPSPPDGLTRLAVVLYNREPTPREYRGGADAQILHDAANRIEALEAYVGRVEARTQPLPVVQANAHILGTAAWLARNGQRDRADALKAALDALSTHIRELASQLEPTPKKEG